MLNRWKQNAKVWEELRNVINLTSKRGTPIEYAIQWNMSEDVVHALLDLGANIGPRNDQVGNK